MARVGLSFSGRSEISTASEGGLVSAEDRPASGAMSVGDLEEDVTERDEDARFPGRDRGRERAVH